MHWFDRYAKDKMAKVTSIFIIVFLILIVIAAPQYWWIALTAFILYVALFYFMRNNP